MKLMHVLSGASGTCGVATGPGAALVALVLCLAIQSGPTVAATTAPGGNGVNKGLAIATEADRRDQGFGDTRADLIMLMMLSEDQMIRRQMRQLTLEVEDDGDKSIMVFDRPRDLKGTAILTFSHKVEPDDQWLYLPALKRVKRLSSADKSGPFMGSEFAYEDLSSAEVEKYRYRYLHDETVEGEAMFVVERTPVDPKSGYSRQVTWIDQDEYRLRRVDYYDRKGDLLKTMELLDYRQYLGKFWRSGEMVMSNHQTGRTTALLFENYEFQVGLKDKNFTRGALSRVR